MQNNLTTELPSHYDQLESKPTAQILSEINTEDQKVAIAVQQALPLIEMLVEGITIRMKQGGRLFYIGAGTSGRLGVLDASEIPPTYGMPQGVVVGVIAGGEQALLFPVENAEDNEEQGWLDLQKSGINQLDTVIGIAASGTTPYVIGALKQARLHGVFTGAITCNPDSPVTNHADVKIEIEVGPEYVTGSTRMKSGTATKMVLNMISTALMIRLGRVKGNKMVNLQLTNAKLIDRGTRMLVEELGINYDQARNLLHIHGSVAKAIEAFRK
jgi:N-acetylmuramic acid 6-phosphate etherase